MTAPGYARLEVEHKQLKSVDRPAVIKAIAEAREHGDLSENAEYSAARLEQSRAETRVEEIEHILKNAEIMAAPKDKNIVELGNTVVLKGPNGDKEFMVVSSVEADPMNGKVSKESPIGKSLMGKKVGEEVEIITPAKTTKYTIKKVS